MSRLAKLKAMPPREIAHRLGYAVRTTSERRAWRRGELAPPDRLREALRPDVAGHFDWRRRLLRRDAAGRFFAWEDKPTEVQELFQTQYYRELDRSRDIASRVARHEIAFFGETFHFGASIDWHKDPVTGAEWPRRYHRDVPVHGGNVGYGDVKHVWELNRHQFFVDLAKMAFLERSEPHAEALFDLLQSWNASVPYATGAPWACALEPAFRVWSWIWAYHLVRAADLLPDDVHLEWLTGFYDHARFLHHHLELYSSPYNHLIGEASALFALGVLFPEFKDARAWARHGRTVLESTVRSQFYADGGTVEQSTFYHHATLGFYLLSIVLAARNGIRMPSAVRDSVERALEYSMLMAQPDGRVPSIGGADDGKPIRLEHLPFWDFRPYLAIGAVVFSRRDFKARAGGFPEDALWMLGPDGSETFERLASRLPEPSAALTSSGYYVARSDWSRQADYVCFDCGEQAAGLRRDDVPSAAHGHADCLSVVASLGGHPVLVDPGFFCYNGDPQWEVHFRKTLAHNTLTIDGRDQARHVSKMAWTHTYAARPEGWSGRGDIAWARGSHDGYARGRQGVVHRRTVWLRPDGYLILYDELVGKGEHLIRANFQFAPGDLRMEAPGRALFDGRFEMAWRATTADTAAVVCGEPGPTGGWVARSLGVREPAPRLTIEFPFAAPRAALLTVLADRTRTRELGNRVEAVLQDATGLLARVRVQGGFDRVVASEGTAVAAPDVETGAALAVVRMQGGAVTGSAHIGGTRVRVSRTARGDLAVEQPCTGAGGKAR
jgi:hypothetical protein